jgi:RNA-directed DNA polymerase
MVSFGRHRSKKIEAANSLKRHAYKAKPLRRVYIPKKNGKQRPLGIPCLIDRGQQALHLLAMEPIAELTADKNSYGFRPRRSCADAIAQCFNILAKTSSAQWILEGDIKACFDAISHPWLLENIPMDKEMLKQWITAGFIYKKQWSPTTSGAPQGGVASATLANQALDGMEEIVKSIATKNEKAHFVRYADDFIITGNSKVFLENRVKPAIKAFLDTRGLVLSNEKTHITHINEGFDFLGFNLRKYDGKLLIKPSKAKVKAFLKNIRETIKSHKGVSAVTLIEILNPKIRGWANYYRHVVSKRTFGYVDSQIFASIWQWCKRKHPKKNQHWIKAKYFDSIGNQNWVFHARYKNDDQGRKRVNLIKAELTPIVRHVKIKADATPYTEEYQEYFKQRLAKAKESKKCLLTPLDTIETKYNNTTRDNNQTTYSRVCKEKKSNSTKA